jgi:hypothetical protein
MPMLIPQPPFDLMVDKTHEFWITAVLAAFALIALGFALIHWARSGRPVVLLLFISGGLMMVFEAMVDTVGGCWFAENSIVAFSAWGRPIPVWLCLAYFFYFGIGVGLLWMSMHRGMTRAQLWGAFVFAMIGDLVFETILLRFDPYAYYGYQPLRLGKFPLWWAAVNGLIPIVLAALTFHIDAVLRGWKHLLIIPLALTTSAATNAAIGWPSWTVINTDLGWAVTQAGGLLTFVLAFSIMAIVVRFTAVQSASNRANSDRHAFNGSHTHSNAAG